MNISMDIHRKSVDMDMDGKFHILGKPDNYNSINFSIQCKRN